MYGIINILTYSDKIPVNLVIRYSDNRHFLRKCHTRASLA